MTEPDEPQEGTAAAGGGADGATPAAGNAGPSDGTGEAGDTGEEAGKPTGRQTGRRTGGANRPRAGASDGTGEVAPESGESGDETGGPAEQETGDAAEPTAPVGWLPLPAEQVFGAGALAAEAYGLLTVEVPADNWVSALTAARDELGCSFFDWLSAVDEPGTGFYVCAHLAALPTPAQTTPQERPAADGAVHHLLLRTLVPHEDPHLPTATGVYPGASWHERETHEMFGVGFTGHPQLTPLLLPDSFEGHPLRKDFVLAARVAKAWPGAKEPGESGHGGAKRRQMLPPGVPDPNEWGPQKGQLPPVPSRPARGRGRGRADDTSASGERPARRTRSASAGSASQQSATAQQSTAEEGPATTPAGRGERPARRTRTASGGSASQRQRPAPDSEPPATEPSPDASDSTDTSAARRRSADAPWHRSGAVDDSRPQHRQQDQEGRPTPPAEGERGTEPPTPEAESPVEDAEPPAPETESPTPEGEPSTTETERRDDA